ncbi:trypsin-like [Danaus plexippus]|uniref:trypsin-like n=1 Tax=Danaus plexippus TaxID=13037 RepID=UPI002AB2EDBC|nr:trypsin-like [Danaus plexippus]
MNTYISCFIMTVSFNIPVMNTFSSSINDTTSNLDGLGEHAIVTNSETFPYMVAILKKSVYISAGALIDQSWVLTGADSLFMIRETTRFIRVRLGSVNYKEGGYVTGIKFFEIHPYFDDSKPLFDVALIKLPEPVRMTPSLNPIRLQKRYRDVIPTHFTVTAWPRRGRNTSGHKESLEDIKRRRLLSVTHLHPLDSEQCSDDLDTWVPDFNNKKLIMCLEPPINGDPCERDIGAPVVLNGILWGVISSWKSEDCDVDGDSIFMSLVSAVEISSWIHSTIHAHRWTKKHTIDYDDNFI